MHGVQKFPTEFALRKGSEEKQMSSPPFPWRRAAWSASPARASTPPHILRLQSFSPAQGHHGEMQVVPSSSASSPGVTEHWNLTHCPLTKPGIPTQDCMCLGEGTSFLNLHKSATWVSSMYIATYIMSEHQRQGVPLSC